MPASLTNSGSSLWMPLANLRTEFADRHTNVPLYSLRNEFLPAGSDFDTAVRLASTLAASSRTVDGQPASRAPAGPGGAHGARPATRAALDDRAGDPG